MQKAASRAGTVLADSAELVIDFIRSRLNPDGGFQDRGGQSDLYYTVFGIEVLQALNAEVPQEHILDYLQRFIGDDSLDLVHLACLVRCLVDISEPDAGIRDIMIKRLEKFRCGDGGFSNCAGAKQGSVYSCFFALGIFQDLSTEIDNSNGIIDCVRSLRTSDGAYANEPTVKAGSTPATAAAVTLLYYINEPAGDLSVDWLLSRAYAAGGFAVVEKAPPDLLSTATALHALSLTGVSIEGIKGQCLDFVDSLWDSKGGFCGHWADRTIDCEYTYYGLLALGHLS